MLGDVLQDDKLSDQRISAGVVRIASGKKSSFFFENSVTIHNHSHSTLNTYCKR